MRTNTTTEQQEHSMLSSGRFRSLAASTAHLYDHYWPPVPSFTALDPGLRQFLAASPQQCDTLLAELRGDPEMHGRFLHQHLSTIYSYLFSYRDGPCTETTDDALEIALLTGKIRLERELLDNWMTPDPMKDFPNQLEAADYLDELAETNHGVCHPLFDYLRDEAPKEQIERFVQCDVIRNEVVDDEVALLVVGLQGMQKAVAAANLWDECGRGKLENFHTFWLRQLLDASGTHGWDDLARFRDDHPWFAKITSNTNAVLLTRPAHKFMAYGCFLIFESWVEPHFRRVLDGMSRVGILDDDIRIYFSAHVKIDPRHSQELSDGIRLQRPAMTPDEVRHVVHGAHLASSAGKRQFDRMLTYLCSMTTTEG